MLKQLKIFRILGSVTLICIGSLILYVTYLYSSQTGELNFFRLQRQGYFLGYYQYLPNMARFWWNGVLNVSPFLFIVILGFLGLFLEKKYADLIGIIASGLFLFATPIIMLALDAQVPTIQRRLIIYSAVILVFIIRFIKSILSNSTSSLG